MTLRVREKILIITATTFLLAIGANTLVITRMFKKGYSTALQSKMSVIANTLRSQIEKLIGLGIAIEDIEGFEAQCQEVLRKHTDIDYIMVTQIDGKILFHNDPTRHGTMIDDPYIHEALTHRRQTVCLYEVDGRTYYNTIVPVGDGSSRSNTAVIVGFPSKLIDDKVQKLLGYSFIVALASLGLAVFLLLISLSISVTKPLCSLVTMIRQIRDSSDLDKRVIVRSKDEIGELAISFNQMVEDLKKTTVSRDSLMKEVAERKQAEEALRKNEDRFKQVAENAGEWIWEVNAEGLYTYSSPIAEEILGYKTEEIVGKKHFYDFFAPDVKDKLKKAAFETFARRESFRCFINPNIQKNGNIIFLETNGSPILDDKGNLCGYRGADRNITERKRTEEELRRTEEQYRMQFEGALDAIFVADAETGILIDCNPAATRLVGREKSELVGQHQRILHSPEKINGEFSDTFKQHLKDKQGQTLETQVVTKTGEIKEVAIKANLLEIGGKKVLQGIFRDITERKQAQEELEKTNEELKKASRTAGMAEVATDVLHNVGNVLNSINVSVNFIEEKVLNSKATNLKKIADMITEHADNLGMFLTEDQRGKHIPTFITEAARLIVDEQAYITEKLQSLTKNVEHIKQIIHAQQRYAKTGGVEVFTSINDIIKDAMEINSAGLKRHGVKYKLELVELPEFHMDKQRILQILVNLISNGKYALSKSEKQEKLLTIRSYKHSEDRLRVDVADNGVGISNENMAKIFNHGFTTRRKGHGFGLHSSTIAAKETGGSLTAHSDGPGNGATFTLELPIKSGEVTECKRKIMRRTDVS